MCEPTHQPQNESPPHEAPAGATASRRGCLPRLGTRVGLFAVLFPIALVAHVTEDLGGIGAWFRLIGDMLAVEGRMPGGEAGVAYLVAIALFVLVFVLAVLQSILNLVLQSFTAFLIALVQTFVLVYVGGALLDVLRLRGPIARDDPRYTRKWASRGAIVAVALWVWVVLLVPLLSQLGDHPTGVPTAGAALTVLAWAGVIAVTLFRVVGRLRRRKSPAGSPPLS